MTTRGADFWADLRKRFDALAADSSPVWATRGSDKSWIVGGGTNKAARELVEALCIQAATAANLSGDPLTAWLEAVTATAHHTDEDPAIPEGAMSLESVELENVAAASITVATRYETRSIAETAVSVQRPSALSKNIHRLRLECGWTFEDLAQVVGVSKDSAMDHVNKGTRPRPETLAAYAGAFSEKLGRRISVEDLER